VAALQIHPKRNIVSSFEMIVRALQDDTEGR